MTEYILREATKRIVDDIDTWSSGWRDYAKLQIDSLPAADVKPVVYARWIPVMNGRGGSECSQCHAYAPSHKSGFEYKSHYCPFCGADMREVDA